MKIPRFAAAALLAALASAPALSQTAPLTPITRGPAGPGQCVIGADGCGVASGAAMDPVSEAAIVGLGQRAVPTIDLPTVRNTPQKQAPAAAAKAADDSDAGTDLVAMGGLIINPIAGAAAFKGASGARASGRQATFDTHFDGSDITPAPVAKAAGLNYAQSEKVEASIGGNAAAFGSDPKLSAGDADFGPGGFNASSNGSR